MQSDQRTGAPGTNTRWARRILTDDGLSSKARHVGLTCALLYANFYTLKNIRPSLETASKHTGLSESTVHRALKELVGAGFLEVVLPGGPGHPTVYRGVFPKRSVAQTWPNPWTCETCGGTFPSNRDRLEAWVLATGDDAGTTIGNALSVNNERRVAAEVTSDEERRDRHAVRLFRAFNADVVEC